MLTSTETASLLAFTKLPFQESIASLKLKILRQYGVCSVLLFCLLNIWARNPNEDISKVIFEAYLNSCRE